MGNILFLSQRLPYPPDKGDKIRSFRALQYLAKSNRIHLATFYDDPDDARHCAAIEEMCETTKILPLDPTRARIRSLLSLLTGGPLSTRYFYSAELRDWINDTLRKEEIDAIYVFSSVMAQYVIDAPDAPPKLIIDYVDVDSEKFRQYAAEKSLFSSWIYGREARRLLEFDRLAGRGADACLFVSAAEAGLFRQLAPELAHKTHDLSNGIDTVYFDPDAPMATKADLIEMGEGPNCVFTGRMDYKPNIDAVLWFAGEVFPLIKQQRPGARFIIAGAAPAPQVHALTADPQIYVTGRVDDMRPYLAHADVAVAPMFIGRGIQNKVLEAASMARPVVTTPDGLEGIDLEAGTHVLVAEGRDDFAQAVLSTLGSEDARLMGLKARQQLIDTYSWEARFGKLDDFLNAPDYPFLVSGGTD